MRPHRTYTAFPGLRANGPPVGPVVNMAQCPGTGRPLEAGGIPESYYPNPWVEAPPGSEPFDELGSINTPAPGAAEAVVHTFQVPLKFDGVIFGILTRYAPGGLSPGSGDLTWRVRKGSAGVAGEPVRNYAAITAEFGDFTTYHGVFAGIIIRSREFVTLTVTHAAGSPLPFGPGNLTITAVSGYYWPQR